MRTIAVLGLLVAGCSGGSDDVIADRQLPAAVRDDARAVAQSSNQFAIDLYGQLAAKPGNLCISPYSVSTALSMLDAGAAGTSDAELRAALHASLPGERFHAAVGAISTSLDTGRAHGAYTLAAANRLYGQQGFPFLPSFLERTRTDYGAPLESVDFAGNAEAARQAINAWVADQTDDKIQQLFSSSDITTATELALVNALVFKGAWDHAFEAAKTADATFTRSDGTTVQAHMMHKSDDVAVQVLQPGTAAAADLIVLPFRGKDLSMVIVEPKATNGLPAVEAALAGGLDLAAAIEQPTQLEAVSDLALPKFAITSQLSLVLPLSALGVTSIFGADADFSNIDGARDLAVSAMVHQAFITVDEQGAEAAAATGAALTDAYHGVIVDHPFVFAIYDHVTHTILFLGRVSDPSA